MGKSIIEGQEKEVLPLKAQHDDALDGLQQPDTVTLSILGLKIWERLELGPHGLAALTPDDGKDSLEVAFDVVKPG